MSELINNIDRLVATETISSLERLNGEITVEYCHTLISQGKTIVGYALYIAREVVFKEDELGYKAFIKEEGLTNTSADKHIEFYQAGVAFNQPDLFPTCPTAYHVLSGSTAQDKVNRYTRIKHLLGTTEHIGTTDIRWCNVLLDRGILDTSLVNTFASLLYKRSDILKRYYASRSRAKGLKELIDLLKLGKSDGYIMDFISGEKDIKPEDTRILSRKAWDKLSLDDRYKRHMVLEETLLEYSNKYNLN